MPIGDSDPDFLFKKGSDLVRNKKFDEALAVFDEVLLFDPSNDMAWVAKGVIFTHQQKFEDAVQSFNQALLINPKNQKAIQNREMAKKFIHVPGLTNPNERVEKVPPPLQYGTVSEYKSNILLFIWPFIGAFFFFFGWFGALIFLSGSTFLIYSDAGKLQLGSRPGSLDTRTWKPWEWGLITFLLWIIGYPLYLYKRRAIYETNNNLQRTSTGSAKLIIGVIGFFIVFAIIGSGWAFSIEGSQSKFSAVADHTASQNQAQPSSVSTDFSKITHLEVSTIGKNWDADAEKDGITVHPNLMDTSGKTVQWSGATLPVDIEIWSTVFNSDFKQVKDKLVYKGSGVITTWKDGNMFMDRGIKVPFSSMNVPAGTTYGWTYATVHIPDGKSYSGIDQFTSLSP